MKFEEDDIKKMVNLINQYSKISKKLDTMKIEAKRLQERIDNEIKKLSNVNSKEEKLMSDMKKKYGNFTLEDIYNEIYGKQR